MRDPEKARARSRKWEKNNPEKAAALRQAWRSKNKDHQREYNKARRLKRKQDAVAYLGGKCKRCNEEFPNYIYDFHHIDPKTKDGDNGIFYNSWESAKQELDKCVLLCANCHRKEHYESNI